MIIQYIPKFSSEKTNKQLSLSWKTYLPIITGPKLHSTLTFLWSRPHNSYIIIFKLTNWLLIRNIFFHLFSLQTLCISGCLVARYENFRYEKMKVIVHESREFINFYIGHIYQLVRMSRFEKLQLPCSSHFYGYGYSPRLSNK